MRKAMFFPKGDEKCEAVISTQSPVEYTDNKKIILSRGIKKEEYDEIYEFLRDQNRMSSGNFTLFPKNEIDRYVRMNAFSVLMRSEKNKTLIGTIFSIPFPIQCNFNKTEKKIVEHGCTTFLNVHNKLRTHGMCMALIRELSKYGYEKNILCSYFLTEFPLTSKSISISSWYRPLNLVRSISLGFGYPNWNNVSEFNNNRIKYNTKMPKNFVCKRVSSEKSEKALKFYLSNVKDEKFVFSPNLEYFLKWIQEYPTFLVSKDNNIVGIFSIASIYCRMESSIDGVLALPLLFKTSPDFETDVMKCLISVANDRDFDALYTHNVGDISKEVLESIHAIKNEKKSYFSLYNNSMSLTPEDLYIPIF